jgi:ABC-type tungstate transport system permease subunit
VVNPDKRDRIQHDLADAYADFLVSPATQKVISEFQIGGETLFYPLHLPEQK